MTYEPNEPDDDLEDSVEEDNQITDKMVKKATYLMHKLAEMRKEDYKEIQNKCKKSFNYSNLSKVSMDEGHKIIDKLIQLTGGEEEQEQGARVTDDRSSHLTTQPETAETAKPINEQKDVDREQETLKREIGHLSNVLQICVVDSKEIVEQELGKENISEGTRAMLVKSFAATLFIQASKDGLGR